MSEADGSQQVFEENVSGADDSNGTGQSFLSSSSSCCDSWEGSHHYITDDLKKVIFVLD